MLTKSTARVCGAALLLLVSTAASAAPKTDATFAHGRAVLSVPLAGSKVWIVNEAGETLVGPSERTDANGTFSIPLPKRFPSHFRVVVSGGTGGGRYFEDTITRDVEGFDPGRTVVRVNAVTTLVGMYRDRHPGTSVAGAEAVVKAFLAIPAHVDPGYGLENPYQTHFGHGALLAELGAPEAGPLVPTGQLTARLKALLGELEANPSAVHAYRTQLGFELPSWTELLEKLFEETASEGFGYFFDKILTAFGVSGDAEILDAIHEMEAKIDELTKLTTELVTKLGLEVSTGVLYGPKTQLDTWNQAFTSISDRASFVVLKNGLVDLKFLKNLKDDTTALRDQILEDGAATNDLTGLQNAVYGYPGFDGVLRTAHDYLKAANRFYPGVPYKELADIAQYYQGYQFLATNFLVQANLAIDRKDKAAEARDQFQKGTNGQNNGADGQNALLSNTLHGPGGTILDQDTKLLWVDHGLAAPPCSNETRTCDWNPDWPLFSNLPTKPCAASDGKCSLRDSAIQVCNGVDLGFKGSWRLPWDYELDKLASQRGEKPAFDYLEGVGFSMPTFVRTAPEAVARNFEHGNTFGAYFSNSKSYASGYFYYALTNAATQRVGVGEIQDCVEHAAVDNLADCDTEFPGFAGAMCVRPAGTEVAIAPPPPTAGAALSPELRAIVDDPKYAGARWGLRVVDLATGELIYDLDSRHRFVTGSTAKIFSVTAALGALGSEYRFETPVFRHGTIGDGGVLAGDLILRASGDLTLGGRTKADGTIDVPIFDHYDANVLPGMATLTPEDPLAGLDELARKVKAAGITRVDGDVVVDDRLFEITLKDDIPVGPMVVNDNLIDFLVTPGAAGAPATFDWRPKTARFTPEVHVTTGAADSRIALESSSPAPGKIVVTGTVPAGAAPVVFTYQVPDAAAFARTLFIEALARAGVPVTAEPLGANPRKKLPSTEAVAALPKAASFLSPPFSETARLINKVSHNLGANMLPGLLAAKNGETSYERGMQLERAYVRGAGVDPELFTLVDGQGLFGNAVAPLAQTTYLAWLATQPFFPVFFDSTPILGVDGSLADVVPPDDPARGHVHAKTGTLAAQTADGGIVLQTKALAGYVDTPKGKRLAFAIYLNDLPIHEVLDVLDANKTLGHMASLIYRAN